MILAPLCTIPLFTVSKELLAELTSRPSTSAVSVATVPAASFTTSCVSLLRWWPGKSLCSHIPSREPKKMQPALVKAMDVEFIFFLHHCWAWFLGIRSPAPNITNLIVIVADLALSGSLLDLINSNGSHETPSFSCQLPSVRLTRLTRYTRCFPENPRDLRKFPGKLKFGYSSQQACPETSNGRKERQLTREQNISPSGPRDNPIQEPASPSIGLWSNRSFGRYAAGTYIHGQTLRGRAAQVRRQDVSTDHANPCRKDQRHP